MSYKAVDLNAWSTIWKMNAFASQRFSQQQFNSITQIMNLPICIRFLKRKMHQFVLSRSMFIVLHHWSCLSIILGKETSFTVYKNICSCPCVPGCLSVHFDIETISYGLWRRSLGICFDFENWYGPYHMEPWFTSLIWKHFTKDYKIDDMKISSFMISVPDGSEIGKHFIVKSRNHFQLISFENYFQRLLRGTSLWYQLTFCRCWGCSRTGTGHVSCNINW